MSYVFYITGQRPKDEHRRAYVPVIKDSHNRYARWFLSYFLRGQEYIRQGNTLILTNGDRLRCDRLDELLPLIPEPDFHHLKPEDHQRILSFKHGIWEEQSTPKTIDTITGPELATVIDQTTARVTRATRPDGYVTITDLCVASGVLPSDARAILRTSGREKPPYGWAFAPEEIPIIKKLVGIR